MRSSELDEDISAVVKGLSVHPSRTSLGEQTLYLIFGKDSRARSKSKVEGPLVGVAPTKSC